MLIHGIAVHKLLYNYVHMYVCIYNFILYLCMCVVIVPNLFLYMYMYAYIYIYIYIYIQSYCCFTHVYVHIYSIHYNILLTDRSSHHWIMNMRHHMPSTPPPQHSMNQKLYI